MLNVSTTWIPWDSAKSPNPWFKDGNFCWSSWFPKKREGETGNRMTMIVIAVSRGGEGKQKVEALKEKEEEEEEVCTQTRETWWTPSMGSWNPAPSVFITNLTREFILKLGKRGEGWKSKWMSECISYIISGLGSLVAFASVMMSLLQKVRDMTEDLCGERKYRRAMRKNWQ